MKNTYIYRKPLTHLEIVTVEQWQDLSHFTQHLLLFTASIWPGTASVPLHLERSEDGGVLAQKLLKKKQEQLVMCRATSLGRGQFFETGRSATGLKGVVGTVTGWWITTLNKVRKQKDTTRNAARRKTPHSDAKRNLQFPKTSFT